MKIAIIPATVAAVSALLVGCGGEGAPLSLDEYLQDVDAISDDGERRRDEIAEPVFNDSSTLEDYQDGLGESIGGVLEIARDTLGDLEDLRPPDEAQAAHDQYEDRFRDLVDAVEDYIGRIEDAVTLPELSLVVDDTAEGGAASAALEEACLSLQQLADENDVEVDLDCEDED